MHYVHVRRLKQYNTKNMNMIVYMIISAFFIYFVIRIATAKRTETVNRAYAGAYDGKESVVILPKDRNKTIYTAGESIIDLSNYDRFFITGHSLEKVGLSDSTFVYTKPLGNNDIYSIRNRFVIFKYDNKRLAKEHPEISNPVDGYKARKVVTILETNLPKTNFEEKMKVILVSDTDVADVDDFLKKLWKKYEFASDYYKEDKQLIVSITYKSGQNKDYSFHSIHFLHGVVRYKSIL